MYSLNRGVDACIRNENNEKKLPVHDFLIFTVSDNKCIYASQPQSLRLRFSLGADVEGLILNIQQNVAHSVSPCVKYVVQ